jgi:hypothetical protein
MTLRIDSVLQIRDDKKIKITIQALALEFDLNAEFFFFLKKGIKPTYYKQLKPHYHTNKNSISKF